MKIKLGTRLPRRYSARYCACGKQASYAVQVLARTLGPGQSKGTRQLRLGKTAFLCANCSRDAKAFVAQLGDSGSDAIEQIASDLFHQKTQDQVLQPGLPLSS
jgi:hypothetical protein